MSVYVKPAIWLTAALWLTACTTGRLEYVTPEGERKFACETTYTWQPSVDKYAVEYVLGYCARKAEEQGHKVVDQALLSLDLAIPPPPGDQAWTRELAKRQYRRGLLTDKEYGYILAALDLGHEKN